MMRTFSISRPTITEISANKEEEERWTLEREIVKNCRKLIMYYRDQIRDGVFAAFETQTFCFNYETFLGNLLTL